MIARKLGWLLLAALMFPLSPSQATPLPAPLPLPEELVLGDDKLIEVRIGDTPLILEVSAEAFGPITLNADVAERLQLRNEFKSGWVYGPVAVETVGTWERVSFGRHTFDKPVVWAANPASAKADGIIGVHHLPHKRVTFELAATARSQVTHEFTLHRIGGDKDRRIGTEVRVGKRRLLMIFSLDRDENLVTAPTANFLAATFDGGFVNGSDGIAVMGFGIERPTRSMRLARPIMLGKLVIDELAVRLEDYGKANRVGEIGEHDPQFQPDHITVSRRKVRNRPDLLTRVGRSQIAHCSRLTYDFAKLEIRLSCASEAGSN